MGAGLDQLAARGPLARVAHPDEIAAAVVFIASDAASYIQGAIVAADGGLSAV
jgi:NAD(P)-dependent dehydrogenase (short-subunit alcohol dehydrogenase family)